MDVTVKSHAKYTIKNLTRDDRNKGRVRGWLVINLRVRDN